MCATKMTIREATQKWVGEFSRIPIGIVEKLLEENREVLDKLAMYLCEKETITGEEFMEILNKEGGMQK